MKYHKTKRLGGVLTAVTLALGLGGAPQSASAQPQYIGEIFPVGFNFCPRSTAALNGQLLAISSNNALFSLLGTIYGGDGRTTFALPDMRGRIPVNNGAGPGLTPRTIGQRSGVESHTLTITQLPTHSHGITSVNGSVGDKAGPRSDFLSKSCGGAVDEYHDGPPDARMDPRMMENTGGSVSFATPNPYTVVNWCIVLFGSYPSRS